MPEIFYRESTSLVMPERFYQASICFQILMDPGLKIAGVTKKGIEPFRNDGGGGSVQQQKRER